MKKFLWLLISMLIPVLLLTGCLFDTAGDSDQMISADKTVNQDTTNRITGYLLEKVPAIREEKSRLASENGNIRLTLSIIAAPEPEYTKNDPDYKYHAQYYWVYVSYMGKDKLIKYSTYLVHKDMTEIYYVDPVKDEFVKVTT